MHSLILSLYILHSEFDFSFSEAMHELASLCRRLPDRFEARLAVNVHLVCVSHVGTHLILETSRTYYRRIELVQVFPLLLSGLHHVDFVVFKGFTIPDFGQDVFGFRTKHAVRPGEESQAQGMSISCRSTSHLAQQLL